MNTVDRYVIRENSARKIGHLVGNQTAWTTSRRYIATKCGKLIHEGTFVAELDGWKLCSSCEKYAAPRIYDAAKVDTIESLGHNVMAPCPHLGTNPCLDCRLKRESTLADEVPYLIACIRELASRLNVPSEVKV